MKEYISVLKKYAVFSGRASMKEYWMFQLFNLVIFGLLLTFALVTASWRSNSEEVATKVIQLMVAALYNIYIFGTILPSLAVAVRRIHDSNNNGWLVLVPVYVWVLLLSNGSAGDNHYGPVPVTKQ